MTPEDVSVVVTARRPGVSPRAVAALGAGEFCEAFLVDDIDVYRFARHDEAARALRREACVLRRVAGSLDLTVPLPIDVELDEDPPFVSHRLVAGEDLSREEYDGLSDEDRRRAATSVGSFLRQMHSIDLATVRECNLATKDLVTWTAQVRELAVPDTLSTLSVASRALVAEVLTASAPAAAAAVLLHGDLSPEHVLIDSEGTVTGIIDFGDVAIGDPAWDFVYLYADYGAEFLRFAAQAYGPSTRSEFADRLYRHFQLEAVEWALECIDDDEDEVDEAVSALDDLAEHGELRRAEVNEALLH